MPTWKEVWELESINSYNFSYNLLSAISLQLDSLLGSRENKSIYDVGCGECQILEVLSRAAIKVGGCDPVQVRVKRAKELMPNSEINIGEADNLPTEDNKWDLVYSHSIFHFFPDMEYARKACKEMLRIASPRARIVIASVPLYAYQNEFLMQHKHWANRGQNLLTFKPTQFKEWFRGQDIKFDYTYLSAHPDTKYRFSVIVQT